MDNLTSQQLFDELQKRLYAIPVEKLTEYLEILEVEYVNRMAANSGYIPIYEEAFGPLF
jgi:predicted nucleic acid-binding protein